jgi:hypothetical protein
MPPRRQHGAQARLSPAAIVVLLIVIALYAFTWFGGKTWMLVIKDHWRNSDPARYIRVK